MTKIILFCFGNAVFQMTWDSHAFDLQDFPPMDKARDNVSDLLSSSRS